MPFLFIYLYISLIKLVEHFLDCSSLLHYARKLLCKPEHYCKVQGLILLMIKLLYESVRAVSAGLHSFAFSFSWSVDVSQEAWVWSLSSLQTVILNNQASISWKLVENLTPKGERLTPSQQSAKIWSKIGNFRILVRNLCNYDEWRLTEI